MSYARWSEDSDLYVFSTVQGGVECCGCIITQHKDDYEFPIIFYSFEDFQEHLQVHVDEGHKVPERLFDRETFYPTDPKSFRYGDDPFARPEEDTA